MPFQYPQNLDSFYSTFRPYDAGLHYLTRIGILPSQYIYKLPCSTDALETAFIGNPSLPVIQYICRLGLSLTGSIIGEPPDLLRHVQGLATLDANIYIALQILEAIVLQRSGSLLYEQALEELRHHICKER